MPNVSRVVISMGRYPVGVEALDGEFPGIQFDAVEPEDLTNALVDADVALVGFVNAREAIPGAKRLTWIQTAGAGVESLVGAGLEERSILLTNGSGVMASNMAEHVLGMMLAFARCLPQIVVAQGEHQWKNGVSMDTVFEIRGQTVALVGLGDIGQEVARRLAGFGVKTIGVRRSGPGGASVDGVDEILSIANIDRALGQADHVVASVPLTSETRDLFNAARFAAFKPGAYFYNVGRGGSVVQADLIAALESGQVAGAGLDVTTPEPLPEVDPLWSAPNVIITGHTSGATPQFGQRVLDLFTDNLSRYLNDEPLHNVVDLERGY